MKSMEERKDVDGGELTRIVFIVCLVLVIFDTDEILVLADTVRVKAQTDEGIDSGGLGDYLECPTLLVLELDQVTVVLGHLVAFILGLLEQLWQREPLACHLVSIVHVHELVVVDAVWRVAFDSLGRRLA